MEFIESERGNQKLNIKRKKIVGGNCPRGQLSWGAIVRGAIVLLLANITDVKFNPLYMACIFYTGKILFQN